MMIEIRYPNKIECRKNVIYAIGSEHCPIQFIASTDKYVLNSKKLESMPFRLIVPKTDQFHFTEVLSRLDSIIKNYPVESVVINDWGFIDYVNEAGLDIILGRQLIGTFNYRDSYSEFIIISEPSGVVKNTLAPNIIHKSKLEFLSKYSVVAVELSPIINEDGYFLELKNTNYKLHMHKNFVAALSKNCTAIIEPKLNCNLECLHSSKLNLSCDYKFQPFDNNTISQFPNYYLCGNCIYRIDETIAIDFEKYDCVIIDNRLSL